MKNLFRTVRVLEIDTAKKKRIELLLDKIYRNELIRKDNKIEIKPVNSFISKIISLRLTRSVDIINIDFRENELQVEVCFYSKGIFFLMLVLFAAIQVFAMNIGLGARFFYLGFLIYFLLIFYLTYYKFAKRIDSWK
ncbi:MAG: hypothetical protein ACI9Z3_001912 [Roseivirga sp.]|jgi:hypothetical protein